MNWPDGLSKDTFISRYWQRRPCFVDDSLGDDLPRIDGGELAWLATQDDVESRLIFTESEHGKASYKVEQGPFEADLLAALPARDWTLLVHDVEKHLPALRAWITAFDVVPAWRVDDLMISFAAPGGNAGPHVDNYDVFLCQTEGTRVWRLATGDRIPQPLPIGGLALLEPFEDDAPIRASAGSVLYLPPAVPHWGIAENACMTYSVGMRAPSAAELRCTFEREFPDENNPFDNDNLRFYGDDDLQIVECGGSRISTPAARRCRRLIGDSPIPSSKQLAITLGCTVTDLKAWLAPEIADDSERRVALQNPSRLLPVHGMARLAYWCDDRELLLFGNGYWLPLPHRLVTLIESLCDERSIRLSDITQDDVPALVEWLCDHGVIDANDSAE